MSQMLEVENKKLRWRLDALELQIIKQSKDAEQRNHRLVMRHEEDVEEWKRRKHELDVRAQKAKLEITKLKKIIQERDYRIHECNQNVQKQQQALSVMREESEKYAREKKHYQKKYQDMKILEEQHREEMESLDILKKQNLKLVETIEELTNENERRRGEEEKTRIHKELAEERKASLPTRKKDGRVTEMEQTIKKLKREKRALVKKIAELQSTNHGLP